MDFDLIANYVIEVVTTGVACLLALLSFRRRRLELGDEPTLPQYFTRRGLYWIGLGLYCIFITGLFFLLISNWSPLQPLVSSIVAKISTSEFAELFTSLDGRKIVPLIFAVCFLFLVYWESRFNPLLLLRDFIYDAFAIPRKTVEVYKALKTSRLADVDKQLKETIAKRLLIPSIDPGDFEKSNATVEYKWAHNCVLFDQIQTYANNTSYQRFFSEPSLKWGDICVSYNAMSEQVAVWKEAEPHYTKTINLIKELDHLKGLLCRLLACLVVFGSNSENEIWKTVRRLGGNIYQARLKHTYKYILIFTAATAIGVIVGREFSIFLHNNFVYPAHKLAHFDDETLRWVFYAITIYVFPIALVFIARTYAYRTADSDSQRYYGFYLVMMIVGFIVSTTVSALILELLYFEKHDLDFIQSFLDHMRWGILPALMCGFVAYQMDNPVKESETIKQMILSQTLRFLGWGLVGLIITLYATDKLPIEEKQLRFTIVGTAIFVVGCLGMAARFKTVESLT
jgi:hypothetical protein